MFNVLNLVLETNSKSNILKFNKNQLQISKFSSIDRLLSVAVEKMMMVVQRFRKDDDGGVEKKNSIKRKERL